MSFCVARASGRFCAFCGPSPFSSLPNAVPVQRDGTVSWYFCLTCPASDIVAIVPLPESHPLHSLERPVEGRAEPAGPLARQQHPGTDADRQDAE